MSTDFSKLPADLPRPTDDGAASHLEGTKVPDLTLSSTDGGSVHLATLSGRFVLYIYPMTGRPGVPLPDGWDAIPGARGCTPQNAAFRDHMTDFATLGVSVVGISAQSPEEQAEFATRESIPFPLLSDEGLELARALRLPTFEAGGLTHYRRITLVAREGTIEHVFYPVFPPDQNAVEVLDWLAFKSP